MQYVLGDGLLRPTTSTAVLVDVGFVEEKPGNFGFEDVHLVAKKQLVQSVSPRNVILNQWKHQETIGTTWTAYKKVAQSR